MRRIKYLIIFFIFSSYSAAGINVEIKNFYERVFEEEKSKFLKCVLDEGYLLENQIYTRCEISESIRSASYIIYNNRNIDIFDLLPKSKKYKAVKKNPPLYPEKMQQRGQMGYVVIKFDINENGKVENPIVDKGFCGNMFNPMAKFNTCSSFDKAALNAIKKFEYTPSQLNGKIIRHNNLYHKFSFIFADTEKIEVRGYRQSYNKLIIALKANDLSKALKIANANIENDIHFLYQKAAIKFKQKEYTESVDLFYEFANKITEEKQLLNESFYISSFSMLVSSLFNLGRFEEIIDLEKDYLEYTHNRNKISTTSPITDFYIGASFANLGNFSDGIIYIIQAQKNVGGVAEYEYIDSVIKQIMDYL
jgi:TonB family protein